MVKSVLLCKTKGEKVVMTGGVDMPCERIKKWLMDDLVTWLRDDQVTW